MEAIQSNSFFLGAFFIGTMHLKTSFDCTKKKKNQTLTKKGCILIQFKDLKNIWWHYFLSWTLTCMLRELWHDIVYGAMSICV